MKLFIFILAYIILSAANIYISTYVFKVPGGWKGFIEVGIFTIIVLPIFWYCYQHIIWK